MAGTGRDNNPPTVQPLGSRTRAVTTAGALLALLLASVDAAVVSAALPRIVGALDGASLYAWPGSAFMVAAAVVVPVAGKLGDMFGRKPFLLAGLTGFVVASVLCGMSTSMLMLVVFRAVQGVFGGVLLSTVFSVLGDIHQGTARAKVQGLASAVFGIGSVIGPPVGGIITDALSWRWVFYINIPLGLLALAALLAVPYVRTTADWRSIDFLGVGLLAAGVVPLLCGLSVLNSAGGSTGSATSLIVLGLVMLAGFGYVELRVAANPVVPFGLFRINQMAVLVVAGFLANFGMLGASYYGPLLYQNVLGTSASTAGNWMVPMMAALIVASTLSGRIFPKVPRYRFIAFGSLAVLAVAMWWLSLTGPETAAWVPMVALVLCGAALGSLYPILTTVAQSAVPAEQMGVATSQISFWRTMGGPITLAVLGSVMSARLAGGATGNPAAVADSLQGVFLVAAVFVAVAALAALLLREVPIAAPEKKAQEPEDQSDQPDDGPEADGAEADGPEAAVPDDASGAEQSPLRTGERA